MPYEDPTLKEFDGYFKAKEPGRRERAENWAIAIGLQKVDGLVPSKYLVSVAKKHIEGKITDAKATDLVDGYYETKEGHDLPDDVREADRVAARINQVIAEEGFSLSPTYYIGLHGLIFEGVFSHAGSVREVNLRKREWVLRGDSVTYGLASMIRETLDYDFDREKNFSYAKLSKKDLVVHFARFISGIWQIHPFREGNTRTTAVFAIKYLRSLRIKASNDLFAENSWYFRNALVRANYEHPIKGIARDFAPLEQFFRNLILGEQKELQSRYLLVGLKSEERAMFEGAHTEEVVRKGCQKKVVRKGCRKKVVRKGCRKTTDRIVELLKDHPNLTQVGLVAALGISRQAVQKHLKNLKAAGRLRRVGPDKGGHWEVTEEA